VFDVGIGLAFDAFQGFRKEFLAVAGTGDNADLELILRG
jgi:hypothetical protein